MKKLFLILFLFSFCFAKAQSTDTASNYSISIRYPAPPGVQYNVYDGIVNDTVQTTVQVKATSFLLAIFKIKHWTDPRTGQKPYQNAANFKNYNIQ